MRNSILLQNMSFYGFHGMHEYERELGQRFYVDVEMGADFSKAAKSDDLHDAVDYTLVYGKVKDIVENRRFNLLEGLATHLAEVILEFPTVNEVTVRIRKAALPIPGQFDFIQVQAHQRRVE